jgi:hypothetical protein
VNVKPLRKFLTVFVCTIALLLPVTTSAKKRVPPGGRVGVVIDERLSALRATPELTGMLLRRVGGD